MSLSTPAERITSLFRGAKVLQATCEFALPVVDHGHEASRQARAASERSFSTKLGGRHHGCNFINLGGGDRERKSYAGLAALGHRFHYCRSTSCAHDESHAAHDVCTGLSTCRVQGDVIVSTDYAYYTDPETIVRQMRQHGARVYYANILLPFIGGAGTRGCGEMRWVRVPGGRVEVVSDVNTRETWEHSDMCWLLESDGLRIGGRTLSWVPFWTGAERIVYEFRITDLAPRNNAAIGTLESLLAGGVKPPAEYGGSDVCYTSKQVLGAMGLWSPATARVLDGRVSVNTAYAVARFLARMPARQDAWRELAAQKAGAMNADDVQTTAELAYHLACLEYQQIAWRRFWFISALNWRRTLALNWFVAALQVIWAVILWFWRNSRCKAGARYADRELIARVTCNPAKPGTYEALGIKPDGKPGVLAKLVVEEHFCERAGKTDARDNVQYGLAGVGIRYQYVESKCQCSLTCAEALRRRNIEVLQGRDSPAIARAALDACDMLSIVTGIPEGQVYELPVPSHRLWVSAFNRTTQAKLAAVHGKPVPNPLPASQSMVKVEIGLKDGKPRAICPTCPEHGDAVGVVMNALSHGLKAAFHKDASVYYLGGASGEDIGTFFDAGETAIKSDVAYINADYANMDGTHTTGGLGLLVFGLFAKLGAPLSLLEKDWVLCDLTRRCYGGARKQAGVGFSFWELLVAILSGHYGTTVKNTGANAVIHGLVQLALYGESFDHAVVELAVPEGWHRYVEDQATIYTPLKLDSPLGHQLERHAEGWRHLRSMALREAAEGAFGGQVRGRTRVVASPVHPAKAMVMGDDGLVVLPAEDAERYLAEFTTISRELGLSPEAAVVYRRSDVEICSSLAWPSTAGTVFGPKPGRVLARTGWKRMHHERVWMQHMAGDVASLSAAVAHVPLLRVWIETLARLTQGAKPVEQPDHVHKVRARLPHQATPATIAMFVERYGIGETEMLDMEDELRNISAIPYLLEHPGFLSVAKRDGASDEWE